MPVLLPFRGLRPDPAVVGPLSDVVCPPYDVINQAQRLALLERSPYNVVRIELPDGDYDEAADLLERWRVDGALARDQAAALYGYRMTPDRGPAEPTRDATWQTVGVIGALVLGPPGTGILPHEQTTPKAKSDRLELIRATNANTSPIWCLCTAPGLSEAVNLAISEAAAAASAGRAAASRAVDDDGCVHELWPITDPAVHEAVAKAVGGGPLLVADGHHRYETALAYLAERTAAGHLGRASAIDASGGPAALMALVVELAVDQLHVQAIHRLVCTAGADVVEAFKPDYDVTPTSSRGEALLREMSRMGAVGLVTSTGAFLARPRPGTAGAAFELDSSRVDATLATIPAVAIEYQHDVAQAMESVSAGEAEAAVFCRPATVAQIAATAHGGARMPPKTTFFSPKPRTGMVLRDW